MKNLITIITLLASINSFGDTHSQDSDRYGTDPRCINAMLVELPENERSDAWQEAANLCAYDEDTIKEMKEQSQY